MKLLSFDGDRWRVFPVGRGYAIRSLDFNSDGSRLWAAAFNEFGWFDESRDGTRNFHSLADLLPPDQRDFGDCWFAFANGQGALFVTQDRVVRWDGRALRSWSFPSKTRLSAMRFDGGVFLDDGVTGLYRFAQDEFKLVVPESKIGGARVVWIGRTGSDWLLATTAGLATWDGTSIQPIATAASSFIRDNRLVSVAVLPGERIAAATMTGGIAIIARDGRLLRVFDKANGSIPTNEVFNVATDRDGGIWATSDGHIFRIDSGSGTVFFDHASAPSSDLFVSVASAGDRVFAATRTGVYRVSSDPPILLNEPLPVRPISNLEALVPWEDGVLFGDQAGVGFLENGDSRHVWSTRRGVFAITPSHEPNHIFAGTGRRDVIDINCADSTSRQVAAGLPDIALGMAEDFAGRLWFGSLASGIFVIPNPSSPVATAVPASTLFPQIPSSGFGDVRLTTNGALFLFLGTKAWFLPAGGFALRPIANWPNRSVESIAEDSLSLADLDGSVWVVHPPGDGKPACVASITPDGQDAVWRSHSIDGLWKVGAPASIYVQPTVNGDRLYITGSNGILRADANPTDPAIIPPAPLVRAFAQVGDNDSLQPISGPLPYNTRKLLLQVAVPEFARRPAVRPQVLIEGIDRAWTSFDSNSERELTGLRDGVYTAHVRVLADTGLASQPVEVSFTIRPPWWRTWPFEICVVAAIAALSYGGHLFRIRNLRRRAAELEEIVKRRTEQANRANAAKSDFIARVSHNIRNPLNGIVGLTLALSDTELQERQREILEALDACAHQLTSLIDDVLDFSRIEAGKVELKPTSCSPHALLESIATSLAARAAASDSMIEIKVDPALPPYVMVDAHRLEEILLNYMTNAIRYAPGHIVLRAAVSRQSPNILECSVQDRGPGFTDEEKDTLFTNFTRLADTAAMNTSGTGLGLALCRRLADLMSGSVGVEGSKGAGARFYVRLPLIPAEAPQPEIRSIFSIARALIVEDADYNAWAFTAILAHLGIHACDRARDGREALALFSDRHFDLILLDRHLPDTDGIVVAQKMRQLEENRAHTLIVCVSAYSTTEDRDRCLAAGMDYFAGKPLTPEKLSQILREAGVGFRPTSSMDLPQPPRRQGGINMSMLEYLAKGSGAPLSRQIERYVSALRGALAELEEIVSSADLAGTEAKAHSILGMARYVDAQELAELANAISGAARRGNLSELPNLIHRIQAAARQIIDELNGDGRTT